MSTILELMACTILELIAWCLGEKWTKRLSKGYREDSFYIKSKDYRDDPVYKKNVQDLIARSRKFEEESKSK
jgi:hypothetical protein